jgi:hypothetical protein
MAIKAERRGWVSVIQAAKKAGPVRYAYKLTDKVFEFLKTPASLK